MSIGIVLKGINALHFGRLVDFIFEFIPQFVMMAVLFGYMAVLIIVKWLTFWKDTNEAPSIIAFMINIFLKNGQIIGSPLIGSLSLNEKINIICLLTALLCVPLMLLVKPLYEKFTHVDHEQHNPQRPSRLTSKGYSKFEDEEDPVTPPKDFERERPSDNKNATEQRFKLDDDKSDSPIRRLEGSINTEN